MRDRKHDTSGIKDEIASHKSDFSLLTSEVQEGRFGRTMALITGFSAVVSGFEAYIQHQRGAFSHWLMWTPVWLTPPAAVASGLAVFNSRARRVLLPVVSLLSLADGVVGFVYHLKGIKELPGGYKLGQYNIVMGPPIFAPLLTCVVGVLGGLAAMLRSETKDEGRTTKDERRRMAELLHRQDAKVAKVRQGFLLFEPQTHRVSQSSRFTFHVSRRRPWSDAGRQFPEDLASQVSHGRFQRWMALTSAFFGVLAGGEAYFEHLRGSYNKRVMWTPVWVTPFMVGAGVAAAASERAARTVLPIASAATLFDGLLGFFLHLQGIKRMPGGFANLRFNITMGPPLFAPLLLSSVGLLGLLASVLRRKGSAA